MSKHVQWVSHKGKKILFVDAAGLQEAEYLALLEEMRQEILKQPNGALVLVDATKTEMTSAVTKKAREVVAETKAKGIPDRPTAVVGLAGLQKATAQLLGRGTQHFSNTIEEAKEWLVKEDGKRP